MSDEQVKILLLGCDGNAGMNYCKAIRYEFPNAIIIGTAFNEYQLSVALELGLIDNGFLFVAGISDEQKIQFVSQLDEAMDFDFIHAQPEEEVRFLSKIQKFYPNKIYGKNAGILDITEDKFETLAALDEDVYRLSDPDSFRVKEAFELFKSHNGKVWVRGRYGAGSKFALPVTSVEEMFSWVLYNVDNKGAKVDDFIMSPFLPGPEFAVQLLYVDDKKLIASQQRERVEHHFAKQMASGQSSTPSVARTSSIDSVQALALSACETVAGEYADGGIFGVDIRFGSDGLPHVTEINYGRYFTTSDFFPAAGLNIPAMELRHFVYSEEFEATIDPLPEDLYWLRGLDREPILRFAPILNGPENDS